jgi:flagellar hook-length control protein FliK
MAAPAPAMAASAQALVRPTQPQLHALAQLPLSAQTATEIEPRAPAPAPGGRTEAKRPNESSGAKAVAMAPHTLVNAAPARNAASPLAPANEQAAPQPTISTPDSAPAAQPSALAATTTQASTHVQHSAIEAGTHRAAPAAAQAAREIIRRFDGASTSFELRLDPPELGRVEVRMDVSRDHRVTAVIAADSPQALTELARHARELEQQLQAAGLQLSDHGLSFGLRQGARSGEMQAADAASGSAGADETKTEGASRVAARPIGLERWRGVRVDMMV